jgi:hypothetical protein
MARKYGEKGSGNLDSFLLMSVLRMELHGSMFLNIAYVKKILLLNGKANKQNKEENKFFAFVYNANSTCVRAQHPTPKKAL